MYGLTPLVGLIAYYPLNGNAKDESGNGNNGTVIGATLTADRFGDAGMAYQFNGTNNYIVANVANLPTGSAARTISLWAKAQPETTSGLCLLFWEQPTTDRVLELLTTVRLILGKDKRGAGEMM